MSSRALSHGVVAVLAALALGACGGDSNGGGSGTGASATTPAATTTTGPLATAPSATEPPPDATSTTPAGRTKPSGGGNKNTQGEPVAADAQFVLRAGGLRPATVTVPSFIAVALSVVNLDARAHVVVVRADRPYRLTVRPGSRATRQVPGQRAGSYPVLVDGRRRAVLEYGGEPGP